jgi:hypothetical protein
MHLHHLLIAIPVLLVSTLGAATLNDLSPTSLPSKSLELSFEGGDASPPPSGSWTATFGASPAKDITITGFPGMPGSYKTTWTYAGSPFPDSHGYELAASPVFGGKPASLTLWVSVPGIRFYLTVDGVGSYGGADFKTVQQPEIAVQQPAGRNLTDNKSKIQFGTVRIGKTGAARKFTIRNSGKAPLTGLSLRKTGKQAADFQVGKLSRTSIPAGGTATFSVSFKPKATGVRNAALAIRSNDADENPFDIKLTGQGGPK